MLTKYAKNKANIPKKFQRSSVFFLHATVFFTVLACKKKTLVDINNPGMGFTREKNDTPYEVLKLLFKIVY